MNHVCQYGEIVFEEGGSKRKACKRPVTHVYPGVNLSYYCCSYHFNKNGCSWGQGWCVVPPNEIEAAVYQREYIGEWSPLAPGYAFTPLGDEHKIASATPTHERTPKGFRFAVKKSAVAAAVSKLESDRAKTFYWDPYFVDGDWW